MKKKILILTIIMSLMGMGLALSGPKVEAENIFYNAIYVLIICILEIIKNLIKINYKMVTIVQMLIITLLLYFGYIGVILLLPIIFFELAKRKMAIFYSTSFTIALTAILVRENIIHSAIYIVLINLYLYQVKGQEESITQLKESSKVARDERNSMKKKLLSFDKYLEQSNTLASLKERNFIAQKLHDKLGHRITGSLMQLEVTKVKMDEDTETSKKHLINAMENLRQGMDEIRLVLRNVKPRDKVIGIEDIKEELLKFEYSSGIKTTLVIEGDLDRLRLNILLIIQDNIKESLTNSAKYSKATEIKVSILIYNKIARIEVRDNGVGCQQVKMGMGLRGIEERMLGINGRLEYYNDKGFVINMLLNLEEIV